jgi:Fungal specific transcription factor domain
MCRWQSSVRQLRETRQQVPEPDINTIPNDQMTADLQAPRPREDNGRNISSFHFPNLSTAQGVGSQSDFTATTSAYDSIPVPASSTGDMLPSTFSEVSQQSTLQLDGFALQHTAHALQPFDSYPYCTTASDVTFWDDPQYLPPLYQGPYADFQVFLSPEQAQTLPMEMSLPETDLEQGLSDLSAPVPSFLDARSSPEPNEGQVLRFDDFVRNAWVSRSHPRNPASNDETTATGRVLKISRITRERAHDPQLMGTFSPELSSEDDNTVWESENLAHTRPLSQYTHDQIVAKFKELNDNKGQYTQFATGNFPSLAACNAFMQLFFEEFDPLFPFIHQPSFDPALEPWLLVLAVVTTGCRFSQISAAVECADLMQEFLRRAFNAVVCLDSYPLRQPHPESTYD